MYFFRTKAGFFSIVEHNSCVTIRRSTVARNWGFPEKASGFPLTAWPP